MCGSLFSFQYSMYSPSKLKQRLKSKLKIAKEKSPSSTLSKSDRKGRGGEGEQRALS